MKVSLKILSLLCLSTVLAACDDLSILDPGNITPTITPISSASPVIQPTPTPGWMIPSTRPSPDLPVVVTPSVLPSSPLASSLPIGGGLVLEPVNSSIVTSQFVLPTFPLDVSANGTQLSLSKNYFKPGTPIRLSFAASAALSPQAWVGLIPSEIAHGDENLNDQHDQAYFYVEGKASGEMNFTAPQEEKTYDFRLNSNDSGGPELNSISFVVTREIPPEEMAACRMTLPQNYYKPGHPITLNFKAPASFDKSAWIGLVPADIEHGEEDLGDQHDQAYFYIEGRQSGQMQFTAPAQEGRYDFRMFDRDGHGKEAIYIRFTVSRDLPRAEIEAASLKLDKSTYKPGEAIQLSFTAPASFDADAWIGLLPANIAHGEEDLNDQHDVSYQNLEGRTSGTMTFYAPNQAGNYDFRLHDRNNHGKEASTVSFVVMTP